MTDAVDVAGALLADRIGLRLEGSSRPRLERALAERARRRGLTVEDYARALTGYREELHFLV